MFDERRGLGLVLPPSAPMSSIDGLSRQVQALSGKAPVARKPAARKPAAKKK